MKVVHKTLAALAIAGLVGTAVYAARPVSDATIKATADGGKVTPSTAAAVPFNYSTGFDAADGFLARVPGFTYPPDAPPGGSGSIWRQPINPAFCNPTGPFCWGTTTAANRSTREGHIDTVHPADAGGQHLRISTDRTTRTNVTGFGVGVDSRLPINADVQPKPNAPNTVSIEMAITAPFGMDYIIQPQHVGAGYRLNQTLFHYAGWIYTIDNACGAISATYLPFSTGWDTTGGYQNFTIGWDTCKSEILFYYGGARVFPSCLGGLCNGGRDNGGVCLTNADCRPTCMWTPGTSTDQLLMFGDNFPGSSMDVDNVNISMMAAGVTTCGDNYISYGCGEQCEMGPGEDTNCPGRCHNCVCDPICTIDNPCPLVNGANGPYLTSSGFYSYVGTSPFVEIDTCGSTVLGGGVFDTSIMVFDNAGFAMPYIGYNDNCNLGTFGADSDPNASCFDGVSPYDNSYPSCLCVAGGPMWVEADSFGSAPPAGSSTIINVNKKVVCAGAMAGACCDSNGKDGDPSGCEDNVAAASCAGPYDTWYANGKCAAIQCVCIPDCPAGSLCGDDDGCGGLCDGPADDGNPCTDDTCVAGVPTFTNNTLPCNDGLFCTINDTCGGGICRGVPRICTDNDVCNGVETCDEDNDLCTNPADLVCNDGLFCNGEEICDALLGCLDQADPCDPIREVCDEVNNVCKPAPIPTVSEWGLAVLALLLLIGAKVYFGRRQAIA